MKIIITEDQHNMLRRRAQRRLEFIDQHIEELNPHDICEYWGEDEIDDYVDSSMSNLVEQICDQINGYELYDEIYEYLVDNGYKSKFRDFFIDTKDNFCSK